MFNFASLKGKAAMPAMPVPARAPSPTPASSTAAPAIAQRPTQTTTATTSSSSSSSQSSAPATALSVLSTPATILAPNSDDKEIVEKLTYKIELLNHINILTRNEAEMLEKRLQILQYYLVNKTELYDVIKDANMYGSGDNKLNYNINSFSDFLAKFKDHFTANSLVYLNKFTVNGSIVYTLDYSDFISSIQSLNKEYKYIDVEMLYYKFYNGRNVIIADLIDFFLTSDEFKKAKAIISILKHSKKDIVQQLTETSETNPFDKPLFTAKPVLADVTTAEDSIGGSKATATNPFESAPPPMPDKPTRRKLGGISGRHSPAVTDKVESESSEQDNKPASVPTANAPILEPVVESPVEETPSEAPADVVEMTAQKKEAEKKKQPLISDHMISYFDQLGIGKKSVAASAPVAAPSAVVPPPKPAKRGFF